MNAPAKCRSCDAPIEWVVTEKGKKMPVDFQRTTRGNIVLSHRRPGDPPVAIYQSPEEIEKLRQQTIGRGETWMGLFTSHFATCPQRKGWRKK